MKMKMKKFLARVEQEAHRRAEYRRIRDEIAGLSWRDQLDIGINAGDADRIARQMIWG